MVIVFSTAEGVRAQGYAEVLAMGLHALSYRLRAFRGSA